MYYNNAINNNDIKLITVLVKFNGGVAVQEAMKQLRRKLQKDHFFKTYRQREYYISSGDLLRKKRKEAIRAQRKSYRFKHNN
jgi:ribosomal protein S21